MSVDWVPGINQFYQSQGFPPYIWSIFDTSPWVPFEKPLKDACIALLSSAGIFRADQEPFDPWAINDVSFREVPSDTPLERLKLHHNYFDHRDALKDLNIMFPIQRLKEMESTGFIGRLAPTAITLGMGRLYKRSALPKKTVPPIMKVLERQGVDAVLLMPG